MKVVGYTRVSTTGQADSGVSLAAQEAKLRAYAALYDLELVAIVVDAGQSAKNLQRPGLQQALAVLESGQAEGLLIAKLDRLTRSVRDLCHLVETYFSKRFRLLAVQEQVDTRSAAGRMMINLLAVISQWEREVIGERTSAALLHKISMGEHVGAPALGRDIVDGELRENPAESAIVTMILDLRARQMTLRQIASRLEQEGYRTKRGGKWAPETVRKVLRRAGVA